VLYIEHGCDLVVNDVDSDALSTTVDALNTDAVDEVVGIEADVSDPEAAARLVEDAASFVTGTTVTVDGGLSPG
jgi:NAD(P)-dependent dehydrogenase (short-subunit alcohol dehydrogenase family)